MNVRLSICCALALLCAAPLHAATQLSIRLVAASHTGQGAQAAVRDVAAALQKSFVYDTYVLLATGKTTLPAKNTPVRLKDYVVTCSGRQSNLTLHVAEGRRTLLHTRVNLQSGKPLILGGFPGKEGIRILVFLAK